MKRNSPVSGVDGGDEKEEEGEGGVDGGSLLSSSELPTRYQSKKDASDK